MIKVNQDTKDAYKAYGGHKDVEIRIPDLDITLTNEDIVAQSLSLTEAIENTENLSFIGCIASVLKFKCTDIVQELKGQYIECDITAGDTETIPLFRGYIDSVTNSSHEQVTMEIVAYDALYKINELDVTSWYNSLTFPITIRNMRDSFFNYVGVQQEDDYLTNDPMTVYKTMDNKTIKGADIIKLICEINGSYGRISRTGKFQFVHLVEGTQALYPREDLYPADDLYPSAENALDNVSKAHYMSIDFENYEVKPITKVQLIAKDGSIVASAGTGDNVFTIDNNPLIWDKTTADLQTAATNLYNTIQHLWYVPSNVTAVGLPYVECGDFILTATKRSIVRSYVLNRNLTGIQALRDNYVAEGDKEQPTYTPNVQTQISANANAIRSEYTRASGVESNLNTGLSNANGRISRVDADLGNFKSITTDNISAINGNISSLHADVANVNSLVATKASISQLDAVSARIGSLEARAITTGSLRSAIANLGSIAVSTVNASSISCGGGMSCSSLSVGGSGAQWIGKWIDGKWCKYLGSS